MTQYFNDLNIFLDQDNVSVADVLPIYIDLNNSLENLKNFINLQNEDIAKIKACYMNLKNNKKAADLLTDEERAQMKSHLSVASCLLLINLILLNKKFCKEG